jgi:hypothetical protein
MIADRRPDLLREASDLITLTGIRAAPAIGPPLVAPLIFGPERPDADGLPVRIGVVLLVAVSLALLAIGAGIVFSGGEGPPPPAATAYAAAFSVKATGVDLIAAPAHETRQGPGAEAATRPEPAPAKERASGSVDEAVSKPAAKGAARDAGLPRSLSREQVSRGLKAVGPRIRRRCDSPGGGVVVMEVVISGSGRVSRAVVSQASSAGAGRCVARAVRRARFPRFGGDPITVKYPFVL